MAEVQPLADGAARAESPGLRGAWRFALTAAVAAAVAVAFADSSIVVLALPELYSEFNTSIEGIAWVITAYNAVVAVVALALVLLVHRFRATIVLAAGLTVFLGASIACSVASSLTFLIVGRSFQGLGGALLLAGALPVLGALTGSTARGAALWTLAGTFGAALGPALGGALTQGFDWRAIFVVQAPIAAVALLATVGSHVEAIAQEGWRKPLRRTLPANLCLGLVFGALVGALFLAVLLVITVWGYSPIAGAGIVSMLPVGTIAARPLSARLPRLLSVCGGALLLALGLAGLALLPSTELVYAMSALALCGVGLGLSVPALTHAAVSADAGLTRSGTFTIGIRHLGLVLALALIAPLLASELPPAGERAMRNATAVIIDAPIGLDKKVPLALDLRDAFNQAQAGEIPDLAEPFDERGAQTDENLRDVRDSLVGAIEATITRAFRPAFWLSAGLAALALAAALVFRRRAVT
jgi:predicted MFS family arabinose efflux permease